jgi:hypothetical protein
VSDTYADYADRPGRPLVGRPSDASCRCRILADGPYNRDAGLGAENNQEMRKVVGANYADAPRWPMLIIAETILKNDVR